MFGGIAFLLSGRLCVGVWKDSLVARIGAEQREEAMREPHVKAFARLDRAEVLDDDREEGLGGLGEEGVQVRGTDAQAQISGMLERLEHGGALPLPRGGAGADFRRNTDAPGRGRVHTRSRGDRDGPP